MRGGRWWFVGVIATGLVLAVGSAWVASDAPDGLERVAHDQGFADRAEDPAYETLPGYSVPGVEDERTSKALAGLIGVAAVSALTVGAGWLLRARRREERPAGAEAPREPGR